jgi:hypothetical protein
MLDVRMPWQIKGKLIKYIFSKTLSLSPLVIVFLIHGTWIVMRWGLQNQKSLFILRPLSISRVEVVLQNSVCLCPSKVKKSKRSGWNVNRHVRPHRTGRGCGSLEEKGLFWQFEFELGLLIWFLVNCKHTQLSHEYQSSYFLYSKFQPHVDPGWSSSGSLSDLRLINEPESLISSSLLHAFRPITLMEILLVLSPVVFSIPGL